MPFLSLQKLYASGYQKSLGNTHFPVGKFPGSGVYFTTRVLKASSTGSNYGGSGAVPPPDFKSLLNHSLRNPTSTDDRFDGNFRGGPGFLDHNLIANMQKTMQANLTPEMKESISALFQQQPMPGGNGLESLLNNLSTATGGGGMKMGVMAFGMGENEKGKKVARAAKMSVDLQTGKLEKNFVEKQVEPDDVALPKETVESYETEGAIEVEFVDDNKKEGSA